MSVRGLELQTQQFAHSIHYLVSVYSLFDSKHQTDDASRRILTQSALRVISRKMTLHGKWEWMVIKVILFLDVA